MDSQHTGKIDRSETQDTFDRKSSVISSMDCTGLAPSGVLDGSQSDAYSDLYDILPPRPPLGTQSGKGKKSQKH